MKPKQITALLLGCFATSLLLIFGVLFLLGRVRPTSTDLEVMATPSPTPIPEKVLAPMQSATPTPQSVATPTPLYPETAVNVCVNGTPLFAVESRETAQSVLEQYLTVCAQEDIGDNERLLRAKIEPTLTTMAADGAVEYLAADAALQKLLGNRTLISVNRTVERAVIACSKVETVQIDTPLLPLGARRYRSMGHAETTLTLSEILYKDGIACSSTTSLSTRIGGEGVPCTIEIGTYVSARPDREPGRSEGEAGKEAGDLKFSMPMRGSIKSYFGTRGGKMHYGVDITNKAGTKVIAPEDGTVIFCGARGTYGFLIEIRHDSGFVSRIGPCANVSVELGQHVYRGDAIAVLATDENTNYPILHFELLIDGIPCNPLFYTN